MVQDPNQPEVGPSEAEQVLSGLPVVQAKPNQTRGADTVQFSRQLTATMTAVADAVSIPRVNLNALVNTIRIDNPTGQWFYEPNAQQWIFPYSFGWVLRVHKTELARLIAMTPTSGTSVPVAGEIVTATYEISRFEPRPGVALASLAAGGLFPTLASGGDNADNVATGASGRLFVASRQYIISGGTWYRVHAADSDGVPQQTVPSGGMMVVNGGGTWDRVRNAAAAFGDNTNGNGSLPAFAYGYNEGGYDRHRDNTAVTLSASAVWAATQTLADQTNYNGQHLHLIIDVTVMPSGGLTPVIQGKDPASGKYYTLLTGIKIVGVGTTVLKIGPGLTAVANAAAADILPRVWRVVVTPDDATNITYSIGGNLSEY